MFTLSVANQSPVLASTASYFMAHCCAYLQNASLIGQPSSAKQALEMAREPAVLNSFLEVQSASAVKYFVDQSPHDNPKITPLETNPAASRTTHELTADQLAILTLHLERGAAELNGITPSWLDIAALEMRHAALAGYDQAGNMLEEDYSNLAIQYGRAGLQRKARLIFSNLNLFSSAFRSTGSSGVEITLGQINKFNDYAVKMVAATLGDMASDYFVNAAECAMDLPEEGEKNRFQMLTEIFKLVAEAKLELLWLESLGKKLQKIIEELCDGAQKTALQTQLEDLFSRSS